MATEEGFEVTEDINLSGWVISDFRSKNMAFNPNTNYDKVDTSVSERTAYMESEDGAYGVRLFFNDAEDNELRRYSKMQIGLKGTKIVKELNPERYSIVGLEAENLLIERYGLFQIGHEERRVMRGHNMVAYIVFLTCIRHSCFLLKKPSCWAGT